MQLEEHKSLAPFTTFRIGGQARWFVTATTEDEIVEAAHWTAQKGIPLFVLGGGSNLLVSDRGFDGLVLRIRVSGIEAHQDGSWMLYRAGAGEDWDPLVQRTVEDNCAGVECLAGIPGSVGGTPVQNVGAYGQEVEATIFQVRAFDLQTFGVVELNGEQCGFAYRKSRFNTIDKGRFIVTGVDYRLVRKGSPTLRYADLQKTFPPGSEPSLIEVAGEVRNIRRAKGMLLVEGDPDCRSAGSFFKNPIVNEQCIQQVMQATGKVPPQFPAGPDTDHMGSVKLSAAWLIEHTGFAKGYASGAAGVSSRHTLALINRGEAKAADIMALATEIRSAVEDRFGIRLEIEPVLLGFDRT
jgi:UDP-N-acetylmuramate dehydrogenase